MNRILIDTSGWFTLLDSSQLHHEKAKTFYNQHSGSWITTNYIIAELVTLLSVRTNISRQEILSFIQSIRHAPNVELIYANSDMDETSLDLLHQRLDKNWSLTDALSFIIMHKLNITQAMTTDKHFQQAGFSILLS